VSVTSPIPDDHGIVNTALGQSCFYCDGLLSDPAVHWLGADVAIYLHKACVSALFVRLSRDIHEIECPEYYRLVREGLRLVDERRRSP
jgi:hypothetical protein